MLPLYLQIEGFYSYQNRQEIDFTKLTEAGLFGIFGNVGSGKSSILEAITLALYGETERLNKQDKRAYNMLNLKSDKAFIDFQFLNFEGKKYKFEVQWKRNKKRFDETSTIERNAYLWENQQWNPLESASGYNVTNLSYDNFRRTIIIPQGQFKEFLELKGTARSEMMKEIFNLDQFDLSAKTASLQAENKSKLENIQGQLTGYENISLEKIEEKKIEYNKANTSRKQSEERVALLEIELKKLDIAQKNYQELIEKRKKLSQLALNQEKYKTQEKELQEYEQVISVFQQPVIEVNTLILEEGKIEKKEKDFQGKIDELQKNIEEVQSKIDTVKPDFEQIDLLKNTLNDYEILIENTILSIQKQQQEDRIPKGEEILQKEKEKEILLKEKLVEAEKILENLKNIKIDTAELFAIGEWYQKKNEYQTKIAEQRKKIAQKEEEITNYKLFFTQKKINENTWQQEIQQKKSVLLQKRTDHAEKEVQIRLKTELVQYAQNLQSGEACMLCGSTQHPMPMHQSDISAIAEFLSEEKKSLEQEEKKLSELEKKILQIATILQSEIREQEGFKRELNRVEKELDAHQKLFVWKNFDKENKAFFENKRKENEQIEQEIELKNQQIKLHYIDIEKTKDNVANFQQKINEIKNTVANLGAEIFKNIQKIKVLSIEDLSMKSTEELQNLHHNLHQKIQRVESNYKDWNNKYQSFINQRAEAVGHYNEVSHNLKDTKERLKEAQNKLEILVQQSPYNTKQEVECIIEKKINTAEIRREINQYKIEYQTVYNRVEELEKTVQDQEYSQEYHREKQNQYHSEKTQLEQWATQIGILNNEIVRLTEEFEKKSELLQLQSHLENRKANISILENLFKGKGFVNYVSSIHLESLCEMANQRFHRLTKNQLSLVINENNDFEVIDALNNGKKRSVKTLSGGQGFQASLCLALTLAENIQSRYKVDKNFFFIDEGFGTQDTESINTVLETLQYLQHENRVVGIISHIEELKEQIPRSIVVTNTTEQGSILKMEG